MSGNGSVHVALPQEARMETIASIVACLLGAPRRWQPKGTEKVLVVSGNHELVRAGESQAIRVSGDRGIYITQHVMAVPATMAWTSFANQLVDLVGGQVTLPSGTCAHERPPDRALNLTTGNMYRVFWQKVKDAKADNVEIEALPLLPERFRRVNQGLKEGLSKIAIAPPVPTQEAPVQEADPKPAVVVDRPAPKKLVAKSKTIPPLTWANLRSINSIAAYLLHVYNEVLDRRTSYLRPVVICRACSALRFKDDRLGPVVLNGQTVENPYRSIADRPTFDASENASVAELVDILSIGFDGNKDVTVGDLPFPQGWHRKEERMQPTLQTAPQQAAQPAVAPEQPAAKFDAAKILKKLADPDFAKALVEELIAHEDGANIVRKALERDLLA